MNAIDYPITTILGVVELLLAGVLGLVATLCVPFHISSVVVSDSLVTSKRVSAVVGLLDALALGLLVAALLSFL